MKTIQTDVLVCGGGCAGLAAALASARRGTRTILVERAGFAGGIITTVGLPYFDGLIDKKTGRFVVGGIATEMLRLTGACQEGAKHIDDCRSDLITKYWGSVRIPNTEEFKLFADRLLAEQSEHLQVLYHTFVCDVETAGGTIKAVVVANKDGLVRIEARQVIDSTGDGDVAQWSGAPVEKTKPLMPLTLHFRIGHVTRTSQTQSAAKAALQAEHEAGRLPMFYGPDRRVPGAHVAADKGEFNLTCLRSAYVGCFSSTFFSLKNRVDAGRLRGMGASTVIVVYPVVRTPPGVFLACSGGAAYSSRSA